jgi:hypothetical protein
MRPGSPPFGKVVLFGAAAFVVPKADGGMVSAVPRLALGTPEHLFGVLLFPTVRYGASYPCHRVSPPVFVLIPPLPSSLSPLEEGGRGLG